MKYTGKTALISVLLIAMCFIGCDNPFSHIPEGRTLTIHLAGPERTLLPSAIPLDKLFYEVKLTNISEGIEVFNDIVTPDAQLRIQIQDVDEGVYSLDIKGYTANPGTVLHLVSYTNDDLSISPASNMYTVRLVVNTAVFEWDGAQTGYLSFALDLTDLTNPELKLELARRGTPPADYKAPDLTHWDQEDIPLASGFYDMILTVIADGGIKIIRDMAHILGGAVTVAEYTISNTDLLSRNTAVITSFSFDGVAAEDILESPVIGDGTISIKLWTGVDITDLKPVIIFDGVLILPAPAEADYNADQTYTIYAADGTSVPYTISVTQENKIFTVAPVVTLEPGNEEFSYIITPSVPAAASYMLYYMEGSVNNAEEIINDGTLIEITDIPADLSETISGVDNDTTYSVVVMAKRDHYDDRISAPQQVTPSIDAKGTLNRNHFTVSGTANLIYTGSPIAAVTVVVDSGDHVPAGVTNDDISNMRYRGTDGTSYTENTTPPVNAGTYEILIDVAETVNFYASPDLVVADFTIALAQLTVTADNKEITVGEPVPVFTYTITGFVNSETASDITGEPAFSTNYIQASSPAGDYTITVMPGTLAADNYEFTFVNSTLTVNPASGIWVAFETHIDTQYYGHQFYVPDDSEWQKIADNPGGSLRLEITVGGDWFHGLTVNGVYNIPQTSVPNFQYEAFVPIINILGLGRVGWNSYLVITSPGHNIMVNRIEVIPGTASVTHRTISGITLPVALEPAPLEITPHWQFTGDVAWSHAVPDGNFGYATEYTATITLTASDQLHFNGVTENSFILEGLMTTPGVTVSNPAGSGIITATFPITGGAPGQEFPIELTYLHGIPVPALGEAPRTNVALVPLPLEFTYGTINWSYTDGAMGAVFEADRTIKAEITLTAATGYTFKDFDTDFIVYGSSIVDYSDNEADLDITITFPALTVETYNTVTKPALLLAPMDWGEAAIIAKEAYGIEIEAGVTYEMVFQYAPRWDRNGALRAILMPSSWENWSSDLFTITELKNGHGWVNGDEPGRFYFNFPEGISNNSYVTTTFHFTARDSRTVWLYLSGLWNVNVHVNYIGIRPIIDGVATGNNLFFNGAFADVNTYADWHNGGWHYDMTANNPFRTLHHDDKWWHVSTEAPEPPEWVRTN